ncbi:HECT ubiquitin-transferase domain containing protein [Babesia ovis]|uniref:HECT ubiquitin-transferase domain containing protein n=1 Tax=Babesia ovis TaxID=5869 RepID=A0A9W5TE75_BABOV|nr:HECT ubiquitin-transferase domain containing protein [Babesia ovis]
MSNPSSYEPVGSFAGPPAGSVGPASTYDRSCDDEITWFRSLIYSRYTFLARCTYRCNFEDAVKFNILQAVQPLIWKSHGRLLDAIDRSVATAATLDSLCATFAKELDHIYKLRSKFNDRRSSASSMLSSLSDGSSTHRSDDSSRPSADSVRCETHINEWEEAALNKSFMLAANGLPHNFNSFLNRFYKRFHDSFLYYQEGDNLTATESLDVFPLRIDTNELFKNCRKLPSIATVCDSIRQYRSECRSKLFQLHNVDTIPVGANSSPSFGPQTPVKMLLTFENMIVMLKSKVITRSQLFAVRLWQLEGRNDDYNCNTLIDHLKDLQDDILRCPCDYSKWIRILTSGNPFPNLGSTIYDCCEIVYHHLGTILHVASSRGFHTLFNICIDVMFSIALRHPDPCEILKTCLHYCKTVLMPSLPHPCSDDTRDYFNDSVVWLPRLSAYYECLMDFEYLSLHHPLLLNPDEKDPEDECPGLFYTSIPKMGCYVLSVDIIIEEVGGSFNIHTPATTSAYFRMCISKFASNLSVRQSVKFISDGHQMMIFDSGFAVLNLHSLKRYSFEFLFFNGNLLVYLNGTRFYNLDLCEAWDLDLSAGEPLGMSISIDTTCVQLEERWSLTPGLRTEMIKRELVCNYGFTSSTPKSGSLSDSLVKSRSPFDSFYERHLFLFRISSCIHSTISRILFSFKGHKPGRHMWSTQFVHYLRLLFENLFCHLECITSICTYFVASNSVNAITLWRLIAQTILSLLSILQSSLSIPTLRIKLPSDLLELMASCYIQCARFRSIASSGNNCEQYHLQFDLDSIANAINITAIGLISTNHDIFSQMFSTLGLDILVKMLQYTVSLKQYDPYQSNKDDVIMDALKFLNEADCIAIFTKRALSPNISFCLYNSSLIEVEWNNLWWKMIMGFMDTGKQHLMDSAISVYPMDTAYCTCEPARYGDSLGSPFFICCYSCLRNIGTELESCVNPYITSDSTDVLCPRPAMLLSRLLLKHGILFLCLNISADYNDIRPGFLDIFKGTPEAIHQSFDRFCDWRSEILFGHSEDISNLEDEVPFTRIFNKDNVIVMEYVMLRLLRYGEFAYRLLCDNLDEISSDLLGPFAHSLHNFVEGLSIVDGLSYLVELFEHLTVVEGNASVVHRTLVACTNLLPSLLHVVVLIWICIKRYCHDYVDLSLCMKFVVLQFHSLVHLLGKLVTFLFIHSRRYTKDYLMSRADLGPMFDDLGLLKDLGDQLGYEVPQWLLHTASFNIKHDYSFYTSLKALVNILQEIRYDKGCLQFHNIFGIDHCPYSDATNWAIAILKGDAMSIDRLRPGYRVAHSSLEKCQLGILAVLIHLLGCTHDQDTIDFCLRSAFNAVLQLLHLLQSKQSLFASFSSVDKVVEIRQCFIDEICSRCLWVVKNTQGGVYYLKADSSYRSGYASYKRYQRDGNNFSGGTLLPNGVTHRSASVPPRRGYPRAQIITDFSSDKRKYRAHERYTSGKRSKSVEDGYMDSSAPSDNIYFPLDIRPFMSEIISFLLQGPCVAVCEAGLDSLRLSTLCRYAMWSCMDVLTTLISDIRIDYTSYEKTGTHQLLIDMVAGDDIGTPILCSDNMHFLSQHFWYCITKTSRDMLLSFASEGSMPRGSFDRILLTSQTLVLEKLCNWYLSSGICNLEFTTENVHYISSWARISLPFFVLQFCLGMEPMNNCGYATPVFKYLLSTLQPLRLENRDSTTVGSYGSKKIGSCFVLFVSYSMLRLCNDRINEIFYTLWSLGYTKRDFVRVRRGFLYLWVKSKPDVHPPLYNPELRLHMMWCLQHLDLCRVEINLEEVDNLIRNIGAYDELQPFSDSFETGEFILWHLCPSKEFDIVEVSFLDRYNYDHGNFTVPIYISVSMHKDKESLRFVDIGVVQHLGGKLEVENHVGIWSPLSTDKTLTQVYQMRTHLHFLLRTLLWTLFSTNVYVPGVDITSVDISSCLPRLLLGSLRDASSMLAMFNLKCDCLASVDPDTKVSFRYTPSNIDGEFSSVSVKGMISASCNQCTTNLICRCEIEHFWTRILLMLSKEVESTRHHSLVNYVLNCILSSFTLGEGEIELLLSSPNVGAAFCELFTSCTRKLGQKSITNQGSVVATADIDSTKMILSPALHGMFLYRWLPPIQRCPLECLYSSVCGLFQSVLMSKGYKSKMKYVDDSGSDPFSMLPHSDDFVSHRFSADFEVDMSGNTLQVTRASNMGGIVLFRIPINMVSTTSMHGSVNFFILSPGRFGITIAPADCVFGSVMDLFDRNDVVGFMTPGSPPFVHDVFAATINYQVGDVLSASFNIDQQEDGQVCLRTELLIAGNSIGSVLEVVYDPSTQNDPLRRMSLVFIFQDPQTLVYNGFSDTPATNSERLVSRETLSTFRSDTASDQRVALARSSLDGNSDVPVSDDVLRQGSIHMLSNDTPISHHSAEFHRDMTMDPSDSDHTILFADVFRMDDHQDFNSSMELFESLDSLPNIPWDLDYDIRKFPTVETLSEQLQHICEYKTWTELIKHDSLTSPKTALMFADSVQLYQSFLLTDIPSLCGLKEELVEQMCLAFEDLYFKLLTANMVPETSIYDCYSWLCVLGCDTDSEAWKKTRAFNRDAEIESVCDFDLPWLLGSSSTTRSFCSQLNTHSCRKLFLSLCNILLLPCIRSSLMYLRDRSSCSDFVLEFKDSSVPPKSLLVALGHATLLCCTILGRVLSEKGCTLDTSDISSPFRSCVDGLTTLIATFVSLPDMSQEQLNKDRALAVLSLLGIEESDDPDDIITNVSNDHSRPLYDHFQQVSLDEFWGYIYASVQSRRLVDTTVRMLDGRKVPTLTPNAKMFATCDYTYHGSASLPCTNRHILRKSSKPNIVEHDLYDLYSILLILCPDYFANRLIDLDHYKGIELFRASVQHFIRVYDFNKMDYWHWVYMAQSVSVSCLDKYSSSVDPLYAWQRVFYMEHIPDRLNALCNILLTELLYCIAMVILDQDVNYDLAHVVHWILDIFLRHPLCNGLIRQRFVSSYVWSVVHILLINSCALPCKLAVVACRLTSWVASLLDPNQLHEVFMVTQYCATSVLHRVYGLCNYYNITDLDSFMGLDVTRQDHAVKLSSAMLVHIFACALSVLLEKECDPVFPPDEMLGIAQYILIGKNNCNYSEKFLRHLLGIPQDFSLQAFVSPHYRLDNTTTAFTRTFVTTSRSKSLSLTVRVKRTCRVVLYHDSECKRLLSECVLHPDVRLRLLNGKPIYVNRGDPLAFNVMRQRFCIPSLMVLRESRNRSKDAILRVGFVTRGIREIHSPSSKVHFENGLLYFELLEESRVSQMVVRDEVIWQSGNTRVCITIPGSMELLRPYILVLHPSDPEYEEDIIVSRNRVMLPVSILSYYIYSHPRPLLHQYDDFMQLSLPFRSGISMSNCVPLFEKLEQAYLEQFPKIATIDGLELADMGSMSSHMALPFTASLRVQTSDPDFYIGIFWLGLRYLWFANGTVQCPVDPPLFGSTSLRTDRVVIYGVGYRQGDMVSLQFVPETCSLYFIVNNDVCMVLDFRRFYKPVLAATDINNHQHTKTFSVIDNHQHTKPYSDIETNNDPKPYSEVIGVKQLTTTSMGTMSFADIDTKPFPDIGMQPLSNMFTEISPSDLGAIALLHTTLFNAIIDNNISKVWNIISCIMQDSFDCGVRISILESALCENQPPGSPVQPYDHYNVMYLVCLLNRFEILKCLSVVSDANFNSPSGSMLECPLMAAAKNGCTNIMSFLLSIVGVDINYRDCFGNTALMHSLMDYDHTCLGLRRQSMVRTVDLLISFGADVLARNKMGATVLDILPYTCRESEYICKYVTEQYNIQQSFAPKSRQFHHTWPGLLGDSHLIFGLDNSDRIDQGSLDPCSLVIDGVDVLVGPHDLDASDFGDSVTLSGSTNVEHLEHILDKFRSALLLLSSKLGPPLSSDRRFLTSVVVFNEPENLGKEISTILTGFIHDLKLHKDWTKYQAISIFFQICTEFCNHVVNLSSQSAVILSFLNFERRVSELPLLPSSGISPTATLQSYRGLFQGTHLLYSEHSLYTKDYIALSSMDILSRYLDTFNGRPLESSFDCSDVQIPRFSNEFNEVTVRNHLYTFDKLRFSLNRDVTKDLDLAIHCLADLLTSTPSMKQKITAIVMQCTSRATLQSRLPPLDAPLWNGISMPVDTLLDCVMKLKTIVTNRVSREQLNDVEIVMLLQHLSVAVDEIELKEFISGPPSGSSPSDKLAMIIEKMQIGDIPSTVDSDGEMYITSLSRMNSETPTNVNSGFVSHLSYDCGNSTTAAFCYVLISDRIKFLDHINECFKVIAPIIGTILNQPLVEYLPLDHQLLPDYYEFVSNPPCWNSGTLVMKNGHKRAPGSLGLQDELGICLGPPQLPIHWSTYFNNRCLVRRSLVNDMYSKIFLSLQTMARDRPYFSIRLDRGIAATASCLKHTLWYQSCSQILNCNPNILRSRSGQRPFMVVFRGEGATDFGGPFQEFLSCIANEVMSAVNSEPLSGSGGKHGCVRCPNCTNSYGFFQDTVLLKLGTPIHPMLREMLGQCPDPFKFRPRCGDLGIYCSSGCCLTLDSTQINEEACDRFNWDSCKCGGSETLEHCSQGLPMELPMYESLGRLFAMCVCMMNPLNIGFNPVIWKKLLAANLSLKDLSEFDKMSSDLLYKLRQGGDRLSDLSFTLEAPEGYTIDLLRNGSNISVTEDNVDLFVRLATYSRLTHCDTSCTQILRGFNSVLPIGRFRLLLDYRLLEFMVCGDPRIDLEVLRAHTVSTSIQLKRDLFDVLATFDNILLQQFLRFVSGRSRLPQSQHEWSMYVEYDQPKDGEDIDSRLPTAATCSFRLLIPRYSSKDILFQRLSYAVQHCMAIDLDAYQVHDDMPTNT